MKWPELILVAGALLIAGYFVYNSTSQESQFCNGNWTDYFNPLCWASSSYTAGTNELNTLVIIIGVVAVLVVALLAFGPQTGHIAHTAGALAVL